MATDGTSDTPKAPNQRSYSGKSALERGVERRDRLLDAGLELIGTRGFARTTVEELCSAAKVSTRHFYEQYPNKESLLLDVYDLAMGESLRRARASVTATRGRPAPQRIAAAYLAVVSPLIEDARLAQITFVEMVGASEAAEARRLGGREAIVSMICSECKASVERGEASPADFRFKALVITGASNAVILDWVLNPGSTSADQLKRQLTAFAIQQLISP